MGRWACALHVMVCVMAEEPSATHPSTLERTEALRRAVLNSSVSHAPAGRILNLHPPTQMDAPSGTGRGWSVSPHLRACVWQEKQTNMGRTRSQGFQRDREALEENEPWLGNQVELIPTLPLSSHATLAATELWALVWQSQWEKGCCSEDRMVRLWDGKRISGCHPPLFPPLCGDYMRRVP